MSHILGISPSTKYTGAEISAGIGPGPGTRGWDKDGNEYLLCKIGTGGIAVAEVGYLSADWTLTKLSTSNDGPCQQLAVARAAGSAGEYVWAQVWGRGTVMGLASAAAGVRLNTTATAGALDDDGTTTAFAVLGLTLSAAVGAGGAAAAGAIISYPITDSAAL